MLASVRKVTLGTQGESGNWKLNLYRAASKGKQYFKIYVVRTVYEKDILTLFIF